MTLAEFLLARIAEDEAIAHTAATGYLGRREWFVLDGTVGDKTGGVVIYAASTSHLAVEHITRHDPARVLAECAAKRRIVEAALEVYRHHAIESDNDYADEGRQYIWTVAERWDHILTLLASVYSDHADFDPRWSL
jgi:hypothetical protein